LRRNRVDIDSYLIGLLTGIMTGIATWLWVGKVRIKVTRRVSETAEILCPLHGWMKVKDTKVDYCPKCREEGRP